MKYPMACQSVVCVSVLLHHTVCSEWEVFGVRVKVFLHTFAPEINVSLFSSRILSAAVKGSVSAAFNPHERGLQTSAGEYMEAGSTSNAARTP